MTVRSSVLASGLAGPVQYDRQARIAPPVTTAVILAAGEGSRLRRRPDAPPKPLTSPSGRTLLERATCAVTDAGVRKEPEGRADDAGAGQAEAVTEHRAADIEGRQGAEGGAADIHRKMHRPAFAHQHFERRHDRAFGTTGTDGRRPGRPRVGQGPARAVGGSE